MAAVHALLIALQMLFGHGNNVKNYNASEISQANRGLQTALIVVTDQTVGIN
jgi:hypothetical protein